MANTYTIYVCPTSESPDACTCKLGVNDECRPVEIEVVPKSLADELADAGDALTVGLEPDDPAANEFRAALTRYREATA